MEIKLKTLTPLWTGGVDQTCDRLHETGLIGSLRWWYEALVRGLGGYACDPTAEGRCEYDPKKPEPPEKQICAACYLFGCTGWARLFRLKIFEENLNPEKIHFYTTLEANKGWLSRIFKNQDSNGLSGQFRL
ncbi:MAG: type III-B CRISPR module RAMP protein Cmr1, partial [Methanothrix sp.]|uniref:type III-B CRISPR module RAMP protein Cmr1 n=1 Tax=Methanothrix sp. TaxID=90426 RepID=UPI003D296ECA